MLHDAAFDVAAVRVGRSAAVRLKTLEADHRSSRAAGFDEGFAAGRVEGEEAGRADGHRAGYADGLTRSRAEAEALAHAAAADWAAQVAASRQEQARRLAILDAAVEAVGGAARAGLEDEMLAMCQAMLSEVLGQVLLQPEALRAQAAMLIERSSLDVPVALHVHPHDAAWLEGVDWPTRVAVVPDPAVVLGGCIARQVGGGLDARLESLLEEMRSRVLAARNALAPVGCTIP